jgi:rod shape-determining protein MreD
MKFLVTLALALVLLTLESVVVQQLGLAISRIDVTVVLVAFLAVRASTQEGAISSFSVGYLLDLMSGQPTGLFTFLAVFTFLVGKLVVSLVEVRGRAAFVLFAMGADVGHGLLTFFFTWLTTKDDGSASALLPGLPLQVTLTGVAAVFLYPLLRRFESSQDRTSSAGLLR